MGAAEERSKFLFFFVDLAILANTHQRRHEYGERLVSALLALAEPRYGVRVARVTIR
jgi:hypothetical protein